MPSSGRGVARAASEPPRGDRPRLSFQHCRGGPALSAAVPFRLERPRSVAKAVSLLAAAPEGRLLAGGQSLTPMLTLGLAAPDVVVSLDRCEGLKRLEAWPDRVTVGAMVTTRRVELGRVIGASVPLLAEAAGHVGSPHVRNFGTVVGNLCHADPGSDLIPAALCLEAELAARSPRGQRHVAVRDLIDGPFNTALADDEMAVAAMFPVPGLSWRHGYRKLVKRAGDLAVAAVAVMARVERSEIAEARVAVGGAMRRAVRVTQLEALLAGADPRDAAALTLGGSWIDGIADGLLPDLSLTADYLQTMLVRLAAAAVRDTVEAQS